MDNDATELAETGDALIANDLSDEALEAAASRDGQRAITWAYCSNSWICWPLSVGELRTSSRVDCCSIQQFDGAVKFGWRDRRGYRAAGARRRRRDR